MDNPRAHEHVIGYAHALQGYADDYYVRQLRSLGPSDVFVHDPGSPIDGLTVHQLGADDDRVRHIDRRLGKLLHRFGVPSSAGVVAAGRLARRLPDRACLYTMFLWNAEDLMLPLAARRGTKLVVLAAGSDVTRLSAAGPRRRADAQRVVRRASLVLAGSHFLKGKLHELWPDLDVRVHHIGIHVPERITRRPSPSTFTVLAVSRIVEVKGVAHSIRAFAAAFGPHEDAELVIIGKGRLSPEDQRLVDGLDLGDRVRFLGHQPPSVVHDHLERAHVFIQHNVRGADGTEEALGGSILEASAHGVPVVVADSGGVREGVRDGETGFLVPSGDITAAANGLRRLYEDPPLGRSMGAAGRRFVLEHHNGARQDERLREILHDL